MAKTNPSSQKEQDVLTDVVKFIAGIQTTDGTAIDWNSRPRWENIYLIAEKAQIAYQTYAEGLESSAKLPTNLPGNVLRNEFAKLEALVDELNALTLEATSSEEKYTINNTTLIVASVSGEPFLDVKQKFLDIHNSADKTIYNGLLAKLFEKQPSILDFAPTIKNYTSVQPEILDVAKKVKQIAKNIEGQNSKIDDLKSKITDSDKKVSEKLKSISDEQIAVVETASKITNIKSNAEKLLSTINKNVNEAGELKTKVDAYGNDFENFQAQLNSMQSTYKSKDSNLTSILEKFKNHEAEIERLSLLSNSILTGSTNATLAQAYDVRKTELTAMVSKESNSFYVAALVMISMSTLVYVYCLPGVLSTLGFEAVTSHEKWYDKLFIASVLMGPAIWLGKFISKKHTMLFNLREMYAHKAALAFSLEGFKKQVPEEAQIVVSMDTYQQVSETPLSILESHADDEHPNPVTNFIINKVAGLAKKRIKVNPRDMLNAVLKARSNKIVDTAEKPTET